MKIELATSEIQLRHQLELALKTLGECYQSDNLTKKRLIEIALRNGHRSILEHFDLVFRLKGISYCAHTQLTRHRKISPMAQSQRYTRSNDIAYPTGLTETQESCFDIFFGEMKNIASRAFGDNSATGLTKQQLRYAVPQGAAINMTMKLNLRSFLELIEKRDVDGAMPETRAIVVSMRNACMDSDVLCDFIEAHTLVRTAQEVADKWLQENWEV